MPLFGGELGEGEAGAQRRGWNRVSQNYQGYTEIWAQHKDGKGGGLTFTGMSADTVTRRGAQRRATEAGGWRVQAMYR